MRALRSMADCLGGGASKMVVVAERGELEVFRSITLWFVQDGPTPARER